MLYLYLEEEAAFAVEDVMVILLEIEPSEVALEEVAVEGVDLELLSHSDEAELEVVVAQEPLMGSLLALQ